MKTNYIFLSYIAVSDKRCEVNQNTFFLFSNFVCRKSFRSWGNAAEFGRAGHATDGNIVKVKGKVIPLQVRCGPEGG